MDFIIALIALALGAAGGYVVRKLVARAAVSSAESRAQRLVEETEAHLRRRRQPLLQQPRRDAERWHLEDRDP